MAPLRKSSETETVAARQNDGRDAPITIKKYANRRLYNTATSSYVTLDHLAEMVREGKDFVVYDAKSGDDITRSVLAQIIFEAEGKGQNLLPINFLRQLIGLYGDSLQALVPSYLEMSMESFTRNQEAMRANLQQAFGQPMKQFEDAVHQNMAVFQQAMNMFNPFGRQADGEEESGTSEIRELRAKLDEMQKQLDQLSRRDDG